MSRTLVRVVKVGGSLLDLPDLADRLRNWLANQSPAHHVLVVGGGRLVEHVRQHYTAQPSYESEGAAAAHWLCVDLMGVTADYLHERLPEVPLLEGDSMLQGRLGEPGCSMLSVAAWLRLREATQPGTRLSTNWEVTSDAIAARLAVVLGADELVLLKSTLPEPEDGDDLTSLSTAGYVDAACKQLAGELPPWRLVNLRADPPQERIAADP